MRKIFPLVLPLLLLAACAPTPGEVKHGADLPVEVILDEENHPITLSETQVGGKVLTEDGLPLPGAVVRLQTTEISTCSEADGSFLLNDLPGKGPMRITAYAPGYFIKEADIQGGLDSVEIHLEEHNLTDNTAYEWLSAGISQKPNGDGSTCADCHAADPEGISLPFDEWILDAHAASGTNPRFLSMYNGTDLAGNQSPLTIYISHRDYGRMPIRPVQDETYFGPGFLLDFPESAGNCSACHLPMAAVDAPYDIDPNQVQGVAREEGINCDFCHKIWGVKLDPQTDLPYSNMPGVVSLELLRPPEGHQLFIGPLDDVAPGEDTYSALQSQSEYCAACHFGDFWGVPIYNSYGEWLDSPYADPDSDYFQTCQDCHMPPLGNDHFAQLDQGGLTRDPETISSHKMLGASDPEFLQNTAVLHGDVHLDGSSLIVDVSLENTEAGHHIPTDSPLRQILLVVEATSESGRTLPLQEGPVLPEWTGDLADKPGKYYAKILEQLWTEMSPSGAYWTQTRILEDTRLPALETDQAQFVFDAGETPGVITVEVRVLFRRAFYDLMEQKGWDTPDIEMESLTITP